MGAKCHDMCNLNGLDSILLDIWVYDVVIFGCSHPEGGEAYDI